MNPLARFTRLSARSARRRQPSMSRQIPWIVIGLAGMHLAVGCSSSGSADVNVRVAEKDRPDWDTAAVASGRRTIPTSEPFNITKFTSGQDGADARGSSGRFDPNGAICTAAVSGEGTAWGAFQIGYAFDNMTGRSLSVTIRLKLDVNSTLRHVMKSASEQIDQAGTASIHFVLKDSLGVVIRQETLHTASIGSGSTEESRKYDLIFESKLEPNRGYYLVLAGRADVTSPPKGSEVSVEVRAANVEFDIDGRDDDSSKTALENADRPG